MSYKQQYFEWDVTNVQSVPVGWELEYSLYSSFYPTIYRLTTYEELTAIPNTFYYSLDDGTTWLPYALGESGMIFTSPYKMKALINSADVGFIFVEKGGTVSRVTGDGKTLIDSYALGSFNSAGFENDAQNNLYILNPNDKTCYKIDTYSTLKPGNNSLNVRSSNPLGIAIDRTRNTFWQIDRTKVSLKNLDGSIIFDANLPFEIDTDYSSSSSSSSSSSLDTLHVTGNGQIIVSGQSPNGDFINDGNNFNGKISYKRLDGVFHIWWRPLSSAYVLNKIEGSFSDIWIGGATPTGTYTPGPETTGSPIVSD